jgi:hypothetical protein
MAPNRSILLRRELRLRYISDMLCRVRVMLIGDVEANIMVLLYGMFCTPKTQATVVDGSGTVKL